MEQIRICMPYATAAGTALIRNICPPTSGERWSLVDLALMPNVTSATDGTNYCTISVYSDTGTGTSIATAKTTNSSGGAALTAGTISSFTLTGTPTQKECTQAAPHHVDVAHAASGVAVDCMLVATYERQV